MAAGYVREKIRKSKWSRRNIPLRDSGKARYDHIENTPGEVWVWAKDQDGLISGKTIPREWLKADDMLVPIEKVNRDLDEARRMVG